MPDVTTNVPAVVDWLVVVVLPEEEEEEELADIPEVLLHLKIHVSI